MIFLDFDGRVHASCLYQIRLQMESHLDFWYGGCIDSQRFKQVPCVSWKNINTHLGENFPDDENCTFAFSLE